MSALLLVPIPAGRATFPGANGKIAFASTRDGGDLDIFTMNPDGTGVLPLTSNSSIDDRLPSWSADGTRIAYASTQDGGDFDIWVMNADGTGKTQLTFNSSEDVSSHWSPDGTQIVFDSNQSGDYEIFVMNADGSGQTPLTSNTADDHDPAWSPDGTRIAFQRFGADFDIWIMNADGSGQTPLTSTPHRDTSVSWAPDGSVLLFRRDLGFGAGWGEVFQMNPDGSGVTNLTNTPVFFEDQGSFSPDGTKIVMNSNEGDPAFEIYIMNPDGTGRTNLTMNPAFEVDPDWGPLVVENVPQHFESYDVSRPEFVGETVTLVDQFGTRTVRLEEIEWLMNPVEKRRTGEDPVPITREDEHLTCHGFPVVSYTERTVHVRNQFVGDSTLRIGRPLTLCNPAAKTLEGPPGDPPSTIQHYQCYDVRGETPIFRSETLTLLDQFGTRTARIDRTRELCNPVEKRRAGMEPEPIIDPEDHLVCYRIASHSPAFTARTVFTRDQFRLDSPRVTSPRRLCVPSEKIEGAGTE